MKWLFAIFLFSTSSCTSQKINDAFLWNIYILENLKRDKFINYDSVFPILGLRVDNIIVDTVHVKYRFGKEIYLDADFIYNDSCDCYRSIAGVLFSAKGNTKQIVNLKFSANLVGLSYSEQAIKRNYQYKLSYKDKVDLTKYRNIYYAEDGFKLFKEE